MLLLLSQSTNADGIDESVTKPSQWSLIFKINRAIQYIGYVLAKHECGKL